MTVSLPKVRFTKYVVLTVAGLLFSGYLSGTKLLSGTCAFNEPCPYFLGLPACYIGFVMFVALTFVAVQGRRGGLSSDRALTYLFRLSIIGTAFAGYLVIPEVAGWVQYGFSATTLGLPSCVYGLIVYLAVLTLVIRDRRAGGVQPNQPPSLP